MEYILRCFDCIHREAFEEDGWCQIYNVAVANEHYCDLFECMEFIDLD